MNNKWLYFLSGVTLGVIGGIIGHRAYLNYRIKKDEKYFEEYEDIAEEYLRSDDSEVNPSENEMDEIRTKLQKNYEETTNRKNHIAFKVAK